LHVPAHVGDGLLICLRTDCVQVKGSAKDIGKKLDPSSSNLPNPSAAVDKAAGNAKGLAADAKQGAKNVASDLSENPLDGLADKVSLPA